MPDNKTLPATGTGTPDIKVASRTVTYSGEAADAQAVGLVTFAGADDAKTVADVPGGEGAAATALRVDLATDGTVIGIVTETAPATDTASSGLNGRLQRIAQRLTSLIALLPTALGAGGGLKVEGNVAHDAVDSGNPVKIGGIGRTVNPTSIAEGQRTNALFGANGSFQVGGLSNGLTDGASVAVQPWVMASTDVGPWKTLGMSFNGTYADMQRANTEVTVLASAARTASTDSADQVNHNARGIVLYIDVTAITDTPSITVSIRGLIGGSAYVILASAAITGISNVQLRVYPGLTALGNLITNDIIPRNWDVYVTHADADSITYKITAAYVL